MAKKYIDAQLMVVRMSNRDIVTESLRVTKEDYNGTVYSGDRMERESWDAGY